MAAVSIFGISLENKSCLHGTIGKFIYERVWSETIWLPKSKSVNVLPWNKEFF